MRFYMHLLAVFLFGMANASEQDRELLRFGPGLVSMWEDVVDSTPGPTTAPEETPVPDGTAPATDAPTVSLNVKEEDAELEDLVLSNQDQILQVVPTIMDMLGCPLNCADSECNEYIIDILSQFIQTQALDSNHYVQCISDTIQSCVAYAAVTLGGVIGRLAETGISVNCLASCSNTPFQCQATTDCVAQCIPQDPSATEEDLLTLQDVAAFFGEDCVQAMYDNAFNFLLKAQQNGGVDVTCLMQCGTDDTTCVQLLTCAKNC